MPPYALLWGNVYEGKDEVFTDDVQLSKNNTNNPITLNRRHDHHNAYHEETGGSPCQGRANILL